MDMLNTTNIINPNQINTSDTIITTTESSQHLTTNIILDKNILDKKCNNEPLQQHTTLNIQTPEIETSTPENNIIYCNDKISTLDIHYDNFTTTI